jgi:ERCC4-type nuclease
LRRIREASLEEIAAVKGLNAELAATIRRHLDELAALLDSEDENGAGRAIEEELRGGESPAP